MYKDPSVPDYIPRTTANERLKLNPQIDGIIVWQTDGEIGFYHSKGGKWYRLISVEASAGASRPLNPYIGQVFMDFTIESKGMLIAWNGTDWVNATGAIE